jgi:hypothetical protein
MCSLKTPSHSILGRWQDVTMSRLFKATAHLFQLQIDREKEATDPLMMTIRPSIHWLARASPRGDGIKSDT